MNVIKSILSAILIAAFIIGLMYGASEEQAIRETCADLEIKGQIAQLWEGNNE